LNPFRPSPGLLLFALAIVEKSAQAELITVQQLATAASVARKRQYWQMFNERYNQYIAGYLACRIQGWFTLGGRYD